MGDYQAVQFQEESVKGFKWDDIAYYSEVDIMFDLADYYDTAKRETRTQTVLSVRERHPTKYFGKFPQSYLRHFFLVESWSYAAIRIRAIRFPFLRSPSLHLRPADRARCAELGVLIGCQDLVRPWSVPIDLCLELHHSQ
jgi:hypothetical protein